MFNDKPIGLNWEDLVKPKKREASVLAHLIAVPIILAFALVFEVAYGWILKTLWGWFVVPIFHIAPLPLAYAIGLLITLHTFVGGPTHDTEEDKSKRMIMKLVGPFVAFAMGYVVHLFC